MDSTTIKLEPGTSAEECLAVKYTKIDIDHALIKEESSESVCGNISDAISTTDHSHLEGVTIKAEPEIKEEEEIAMSYSEIDIELPDIKQECLEHSDRYSQTAEDMEHLITSVQRFPCLWRMDCADYKHIELKEEAWREVIKECNLPDVKEAKCLWKKLRDGFRQANARYNTTTGQAATPAATKRKYFHLMEFLIPTLTNRPTQSNVSTLPKHTDDPIDIDDVLIVTPARKSVKVRSFIEYEQRRRGRRSAERDLLRRQIMQRPSEEESTLVGFFINMGKMTAEFRRDLQIRVQKEVFNSVMAAHEDNYATQNHPEHQGQ